MIKMTALEKDVFCAAALDAGRSIPEIAAMLKVRTHKVGYALRNLVERNILGPVRPALNLYLAGYSDYAFFCTFTASQSAKRAALLKAMDLLPGISWCAEIGGAYHYAISVLAKHPGDAAKTLSSLSSQAAGSLQADLALRLKVNTYGRKYLSPAAKKGSVLSFGGPPGEIVLEAYECRILWELANSSGGSWRQAAQRLGLSSSSLQRAVHRLEQSGIINGFYYEVDPTRLGIQVFNLLVHTRGLCGAAFPRLEKFAAEHPRIVHYIECIGRWNFELVVEGNEAWEAVEVAKELQDTFSAEIIRIETLPVFRYQRASFYPFPPEGEKKNS